MSWSEKYKKSIDCNNPKGFSQKAHCQGRKKKMNEEKKNGKCKAGSYYCYTDKVCKPIPNGFMVDPQGMLRKENGASISEEGLRDWFGKSKSKDGKKGWVNVVTGDSCASDKPGEGIPKCVSSAKRASMSKKERLAAAAAKRREDPGQQDKSGASKPTMVKTDRKVRKEEMEVNEAKDKPGKGSGKKDACYHKVKSRYSVWPSAYASGALVKCRKKGAANWGNKTEEKDHEYSMARSEISTIISAAKRLKKKMGKGEGELKAWVQSKITKAADYIDTAADYVESGEHSESTNMLDEAGKKCWKGYKKVGTQKLFGKTYNRCVKEDVCPVCGYDPCQCLEGTISEIHSQAHTPHEVPGKNIKSLAKKAVKRVDVDVDGDVDKKDPTTPAGTSGTKRKIHAPHEIPTGDIKKLVKKAVKRIDVDVDGDVDHNDPKAGDYGEFVPTPDGKKRITTTLKKESFTIDKGAHKTAQRREKIRTLVNRGEGGERDVAKKKLGATAELPRLKEFAQFMEDWQKVNKSDKTDGMSPAAVKAYRRENPGSKLKTAVTGDPKPGSKDSKRRKSFCSRSKGQQDMHNIDCSKTPDKAICKARRRWKC